MAFRTFQLTLTAVAQRLSDVYGDGVGVVNPANDIPYRQVTFQGLLANANPVYIGDTSSVSSTVHGIRVEDNDDAQPIILGSHDAGPLKLSDFWVLGTNAEVLVVSGIPF